MAIKNNGIVRLIEFLDTFKSLGYDIYTNDLEGLMTQIEADIKAGKLVRKKDG